MDLCLAGLARETASEPTAGKLYAQLGRKVLDDGWPALDGIQIPPILRPYDG
jgi:hypothetical protein